VEPKILVVDDDPEMLDIVTITLEQHGYQVIVASDCAHGMEVALSESPQVVITDLKMPAMNGLEMVYDLRHHGLTQHIPILALTGYRMEQRTNAIMAGADRILGKPFTPDLLIILVQRLLNRESKGSLTNHILCVEDGQETCELIEIAMPHLKFTFAHTLADGLDLIRRGIFDLYLLDNWLPDGSGIQLCRQIRRTDAISPVVFLSAASYARDHDHAMEAGATAYIDKPVDPFRLERILVDLLSQVKSRSAKSSH